MDDRSPLFANAGAHRTLLVACEGRTSRRDVIHERLMGRTLLVDLSL